MAERKEWKSLHMINKKVHFLGYRPMHLMMIACLLFLVGFFYWWLVIILLIPIYYGGVTLSKAHHVGNPDLIISLFVWHGTKKYFIDKEILFEKLIKDVWH